MEYCEINLARDLILSRKKRKKVYKLMQGYLFISSIFLGIAIYQAVRNIKSGITCYNRASLLEDHFKQGYPGQSDMKDFADCLLSQTEHSRQTAESMEQSLPPKIRTSLPILTSVIRQADSSSLHKLTFVQKPENKPAISFSITVPADRSSSSSTAFMRGWKKDQNLTRQLAAITPTTTRRQKINSEDVFIMSYRGTFKE